MPKRHRPVVKKAYGRWTSSCTCRWGYQYPLATRREALNVWGEHEIYTDHNDPLHRKKGTMKEDKPCQG